MRPTPAILLASLLLCAAAPASSGGTGVPELTGSVPHASLASPPRKSPPRALWVWGAARGRDLVRLARRRGLTDVFVEVTSADAGTRALASRLQRAGLHAWAMTGHASWARVPREAGRWAAGVAAADRFTGAVLDIEPYLLDGWRDPARRAGIIRGYLRALRTSARRLGTIPLWVAVPFWFDHDEYRGPAGTLTDRVLQIADGLVVMAYRDHATGKDGIVQLVADEIAAAERRGKRVWVGVQTAQDTLDKLTFFEEGNRAMELQLDQVAAAWHGHPAFAGIAIHHYAAYRLLRR